MVIPEGYRGSGDGITIGALASVKECACDTDHPGTLLGDYGDTGIYGEEAYENQALIYRKSYEKVVICVYDDKFFGYKAFKRS